MSDKVFLDTNLWIYLYSDKVKGRKVKQLVDERFESIVVSTQVLGELFHVLTKNRAEEQKRGKGNRIRNSRTLPGCPYQPSDGKPCNQLACEA